MINRNYNINLNIHEPNKYIKLIKVRAYDHYQAILNVKVFREKERLDLTDKFVVVRVLTSEDEVIKYWFHETIDNAISIRLRDFNVPGQHILHITLLKDDKQLTLPPIKFEVLPNEEVL